MEIDTTWGRCSCDEPALRSRTEEVGRTRVPETTASDARPTRRRMATAPHPAASPEPATAARLATNCRAVDRVSGHTLDLRWRRKRPTDHSSVRFADSVRPCQDSQPLFGDHV